MSGTNIAVAILPGVCLIAGIIVLSMVRPVNARRRLDDRAHDRAHGAATLRRPRSSRSLARPINPNTMSRANIVSTARKR